MTIISIGLGRLSTGPSGQLAMLELEPRPIKLVLFFLLQSHRACNNHVAFVQLVFKNTFLIKELTNLSGRKFYRILSWKHRIYYLVLVLEHPFHKFVVLLFQLFDLVVVSIGSDA